MTKRARATKQTSSAWKAQNELLAEVDRARAVLRKRLERFDDATLDRLRALFAELGRVVALETPAADSTLASMALVHDMFFPARPILRKPRRKARIDAALEPIRSARAELQRGGEPREHARFVRWRLSVLVDPAFSSLELDVMAKDLDRRTTCERLLVKWNAHAGRPLGALSLKDVTPSSSRPRRRAASRSRA